MFFFPSNYKIIGWVSQILRDNPVVSNSFELCGITQNDETKYLNNNYNRHGSTKCDITDANEVDEMFVDDLTDVEESFDSDMALKY